MRAIAMTLKDWQGKTTLQRTQGVGWVFGRAVVVRLWLGAIC